MSRGTAPAPGLFPLEDSDDSGIKLPLDGITVSPAPCHPGVNKNISINKEWHDMCVCSVSSHMALTQGLFLQEDSKD